MTRLRAIAHLPAIRSASLPARLAAGVLAGLLALGALAGPAAADPSRADAERAIAELAEKIPVTVEDRNEAKVLLAESEAALVAIDQQIAALEGELGSLEVVVDELVGQLYRGDQISTIAVLLQAGSAQTYFDQAATIGYLNRGQQDAFAEYAEKKRALDGQRFAVEATAATARETEKKLGEQEATLQAEMAEWKELRESLGEPAVEEASDPDGGSDGDGDAAGSADSDSEDSGGAAPAYTGPVSERGRAVVDFAYAQLGKPYVFGADGPGSYDCSGLTLAAYATVGISLPHSARSQLANEPSVSRSELQPGDLISFYGDGHHIGIYVGDGNVIHAPKPGDVVHKTKVEYMPYNGAVRPA